MATFERGMACLLFVASLPCSSSLQLGRAALELLQGPAWSGAGPLREPGCFVRKVRGCPKHPQFNGTGWRHAESAEKYRNARLNRTVCVLEVWMNLTEWCGTDAIEVVFVPPPDPNQASPRENKQQGADSEAGQEDIGAVVPARAEKAPGAASPLPLEPGCFVRTPSGCPKYPSFGSPYWKHDEYGERYTFAKAARSYCEVMRKEQVASWCGIEDVEMLFVAASEATASTSAPPLREGSALNTMTATRAPAAPGCFVRTPFGCPNHPTFHSSEWKHEENAGARMDRSACERSRRDHIANWCGVEDVEMLFIPVIGHAA